MRMADRDGDGKLSEQEFLDGAERLSRFLSRRQRRKTKRDFKATKARAKAKSGQFATTADKK